MSFSEKDGKFIPFLLENASQDQQSELRISSVSYENAGLYECRADNSVLQSISSNFTVTIRGRNNATFEKRYLNNECLISVPISVLNFHLND